MENWVERTRLAVAKRLKGRRERNWWQLVKVWGRRSKGQTAYEKNLVKRGCRNKLAHPDLLSAMLHAQSLTLRPGKVVLIYGCELCGCEHVGNLRGNEK